MTQANPIPANETNKSVIGYVQGEPIVVDQGPLWLAKLLNSPPKGSAEILFLVFVFLIGGLIYALERVEVTDPVVHEMIDNVSYILGMGGTTAVLVELDWFAYIGDVIGGVIVGWFIARGVIAPAGVEIYRGIQQQERDSSSERAQMMVNPWFETLLLMPVALIIAYFIMQLIGGVGLLLLCGLILIAVFVHAWRQTRREVREMRTQKSDRRNRNQPE